MKIDFQHHQAAHCENGVISNLLRHEGLILSEPMVFGIGSGIFFAYLPMIKVNGIPGTTFRPLPGGIFKTATKALGIKMNSKKYRNPDKAMKDLDANLAKGIPTGMVVGVFHLNYFPKAYRFHFNAHNIIATGKQDDEYIISDPVMEGFEKLTSRDLRRVRYAKGVMMPKGKMYFVEKISKDINLERAIRRGLKRSAFIMTRLPGPIIGVNGMRYLSKRIRKWPKKLGKRRAAQYLGQIVRMQEEIGTGGAGFRFLFSAFLQEASEVLKNPTLFELSHEMTAIGDKWRNFAIQAGRICKGRDKEETYDGIADLLLELADDEKQLFRNIEKALK